jgi:hypothetical protein
MHRIVSAAVTHQYQRDERIYGIGDRTGCSSCTADW